MPFAVLKSIREVSSEDKIHSASNLLHNEAGKKWKTGEIGEKSAFVIIEMETAYSIKGIDIGNEYSAFIEVLVGGPACTRENFKEILITCSFMTPIESKNSSNSNRVRCFNREALVKEVADEKWKLLKIVCTQPFNRAVNYGLSFIKIHVDESPGTQKKVIPNGTTNLKMSNSKCGSFSLREDSPDSESESTTSLFNRWKMSRNKTTDAVSTVPRIPSLATIKKPNENFTLKNKLNTSSPAAERISSTEGCKLPDRNRDSLCFTDDDEQTNMQDAQRKKLEKLEKVIAADQERVSKEREKAQKPKKCDSMKNERKSIDHKPKANETKTPNVVDSKLISSKPSSIQSPNTKLPTPSTSAQRRPSTSPCVSEKAKKQKLDKPVLYKPFNQLLRGVVLVISGIQNPHRADLRNKALALGAKYKPDWDGSCTHLICAFKNTPKYNQVRGVGKIITRSWIEDCHSQKKHLPWRRYALDGAELTKPESDDEIFDETLKPAESKPSTSRKRSEEDETTSKPSDSRMNSDDDDDIQELYDNTAAVNSQVISSGSDTEDEIQKVLATTSPKTKQATKTNDIFEVTTEEEDYVSKRRNTSPKVLNFFKGLTFFLSDQLSATDKIKVERYIEQFDGTLTRSMDKANYVIASEQITVANGFKGEIVKPLWILECNDSESCIPTKRYLVT